MKSDYAQPTPALWGIWREWVDLHRQLRKGSASVVPPFLSAASRKQTRRPIIVVGKATKDGWDPQSYEGEPNRPESLIRNRLELNRRIVLEDNNGGSFWKFFNKMGDLNSGRENVIWSNVAKIGCPNKNPSGDVLKEQSQLAKQTLRTEFEQYRPALVVFTTHMFGNNLIHEALGTRDECWSHSNESDPDDNVWWIEELPAFPGVGFLWTRHPERKSRGTIAFWEAKAKELLVVPRKSPSNR